MMNIVGNRAEADRWLATAEKLLSTRDLHGARTFAIRARECDVTRTEFADRILAVSETLLAGETPVSNTHHYDWYAILRIARFTHNHDLVASQYRLLALLLNPAKNRLPFSDQAFKLVSDAWYVLSNPTKKALYDHELQLSLLGQLGQLGQFGLQFQPQAQHLQQPQQVPPQYQPQYREQPQPQPQYREQPQPQYREHSQSQYREQPQSQYREQPQPQQREQPQPQLREQPQPQQREQPQPQLREQPQSQYREQPQPHHREQPQPQPHHREQPQPQPHHREQPQPQPQHREQPQPQPQHREQPQPQHREQPLPQHREQPLPQHREQPLPHHREEPLPQHREQPQPQHREQPQPQHREQPQPQHREQPQPQHREQPQPQPQPLYREEPQPQHREQPQPQYREQPQPQHREQPRPQHKEQPQSEHKEPPQQREQRPPPLPPQTQTSRQSPPQPVRASPRRSDGKKVCEEERPNLNNATESVPRTQSDDPIWKTPSTEPSWKSRETEPTWKARSTGVSEPSQEQSSESGAETFWTACPYCYMLFEYEKIYAECTLRCQNCRKPFHAIMIPTPPLNGKTTYFCCWGYFPLGVSSSGKDKSTWSPFSSMFACPIQNVSQDQNKKAVKKKPSAPRVYYDDDVYINISEPSDDDDYDEDWEKERSKKKAKFAKGKVSMTKQSKKSHVERVKKGKPTVSAHVQVGRGGGSDNGEDTNGGSVVPQSSAVGTSSGASKVVGSSGRKQMGIGAKDLGKLDLNVEFSNEVEEPAAASRMSGGNGGGNGEEDNMEGIGFFEGLDEFLSSLPILSVVSNDKVKAT